MDVKVKVLIAQKYTGYGKDVRRKGQAIFREEGDTFICPDYYAQGLAGTKSVEILALTPDELEVELNAIEAVQKNVSAAAEELIAVNGLDIEQIIATGKDNTVTVKDVRVYIALIRDGEEADGPEEE